MITQRRTKTNFEPDTALFRFDFGLENTLIAVCWPRFKR